MGESWVRLLLWSGAVSLRGGACIRFGVGLWAAVLPPGSFGCAYTYVHTNLYLDLIF